MAEEMTALLSDTLHQETKRRLEHVIEPKARTDRGLSEWREYTSAILSASRSRHTKATRNITRRRAFHLRVTRRLRRGRESVAA